MNPYLDIVLRTLSVYLFIIVAIPLFGKKELSQLSVIDLVFIMLISNSVPNAMVGPGVSFSGGLIAAGYLFILNFLLKNLFFKSQKISTFLQDEPVMLLHEGKTLNESLSREKITIMELETTVREHEVSSIDQVYLAVLETDESISILTENYKHIK